MPQTPPLCLPECPHHQRRQIAAADVGLPSAQEHLTPSHQIRHTLKVHLQQGPLPSELEMIEGGLKGWLLSGQGLVQHGMQQELKAQMPDEGVCLLKSPAKAVLTALRSWLGRQTSVTQREPQAGGYYLAAQKEKYHKPI